MAPQPIEDIDFPALGDKLLDLLVALWTLICDICIVIWSYISEAFWAVWMWPPFESFRNEFVAALIALEEYAAEHPVTTTAIAILALVVIPGVLNTISKSLLHCLGFTKRDVLRDSYAANYQSTSYGGNVRRGSKFSRFQSQGAR